ncbi:MAG: adenylosuccinate lyase [Planctomycetota bacterium]
MNGADERGIYQSPLATRYAGRGMAHVFSDDFKFGTWRKLWIALAESERELGLDISEEQVAELKEHGDDINYEVAERIEREIRHDVMAHVRAFGRQCPAAKGIIHLGATSCFVTDNTELIQIRAGLRVLRAKLARTVDRLGAFAMEHRDLPTLAFTHFQPAQPTTVGKRACLWAQDFALDLEEVAARLDRLRFRGVKGTTGTQASFLALFDGDASKVLRLEQLVAEKMGFESVFPVTGQTYPRKVDAQALAALSGIAQSASKMATDIRLLQHLNEIEEPFGKKQVGSSAMAYKRNPMRSERICALARFVITVAQNAPITAATQWLERTLDDSANRRLALAESFLAADAILNLCLNVTDGLVVNAAPIARRLRAHLPFMATEEVLMAAVQAGGDRQELHERIRVHSQAAVKAVKEEGKPNDLLDRLAADPAFEPVHDMLDGLTNPKRFVGRAPAQVTEFIEQVVEPVRETYRSVLADLEEERIEV